MPVLMLIFLTAVVLAGVDIVVSQWGADSRPSLGDDHIR
jgi:hypothetical protein